MRPNFRRGRKFAYLSPIKNDIATASKKLVFDLETINWIEPYACGMYDGKNMQIFEGRNCVDQFLDTFLVKKYRGFAAYAHNGGKFDFSFLLQRIIEKDSFKQWTIKPMRAGSRIIQIDLEKNKHKWTIRDSMALFPNASLKNLTDNFDVKSKKGDFEHSKINWRNWQKLAPEWKPYLVNDCKGLYEVLEIFESFLMEKFNVSLRKNITIAQTAMHTFRKKYLKFNIATYQATENDIRKAFYGGRVEIFKTMCKKANYYDVNSLYPSVMKKHFYPVGTPIKSFIMTVEDFGVAYAFIEVPEDIDIPVLPYRTEAGKLIFPRGKFSGWYCTPELQLAKKKGYKITIEYGYKFKKVKLFKEYIDDLYKIKVNSKRGSVDYETSKLLQNSLFGKFGQRRERKSIVMFPESHIGLTPIDFFGDIPIYEKVTESKAKHILPAIAAFVSSYARVDLYNNLLDGNDPVYCDTDSVVTAKTLHTSKKLGALKLEMPINRGIFLLPKMYAIQTPDGEYIRCKGFPKGLFDYKIFETAYKTKDFSIINYEKTKIATPFESWRRNKTFVSMIKQTRKVVAKYDKRIINSDGITTTPLIVND